MAPLPVLLALHDPALRPGLAGELEAAGLAVRTSRNLAHTWSLARDEVPAVVLVLPLDHDPSGPELASLLQLAEQPGGPALVVLTPHPGRLEPLADRLADFLDPDDSAEEVARRLHFAGARREALAALRSEQQRLIHQSTTDYKTGLANDRHFHGRCRIECARATREGNPLTVLMIDLDEFKAVNDEHDHPFGDHVLATVATVLSRDLRPFDLPARLGGDEFAVLLPNTTLEAGLSIAERLRAAVEAEPFVTADHEARVTVTIGVATWDPADEKDFEATLTAADHALLEAKRLGRNRVEPTQRPRRKRKARTNKG